VVRGDGGREWFADTLRAQGAVVSLVAAYRRLCPPATPQLAHKIGAALAAPREHLWLFSSSEAIANLQTLAPDSDWSASRGLATHPRIVQRARDAGFGSVTPTRPEFDDVIACIQSIDTRTTP
jgi:uroporphyrinogen-III synthase